MSETIYYEKPVLLHRDTYCRRRVASSDSFFFFKQKTAYEIS